MTKDAYAKLTFVLALIAAGLAFTAAAIEYSGNGRINIGLIAAGLFVLAFGIGAKNRMRR